MFTLRAKLSGAVYCYRSCLWACLQRAGGREVSEPYYSQRAQCLRLCERFFHVMECFEWFDMVVPAYRGCPGKLAVKRGSLC